MPRQRGVSGCVRCGTGRKRKRQACRDEQQGGAKAGLEAGETRKKLVAKQTLAPETRKRIADAQKNCWAATRKLASHSAPKKAAKKAPRKKGDRTAAAAAKQRRERLKHFQKLAFLRVWRRSFCEMMTCSGHKMPSSFDPPAGDRLTHPAPNAPGLPSHKELRTILHPGGFPRTPNEWFAVSAGQSVPIFCCGVITAEFVAVVAFGTASALRLTQSLLNSIMLCLGGQKA